MPRWVGDAYAGYAKRFPKQFDFHTVELAQSRDANPATRMRQEGELLLGKLDPQDYVVALEVGGKSLSTPELARQLENWQSNGRNVSLLIGGPDGLSPDVSARAELSLSLSAMTLPHPLARIVLVEQIYRAHSILTNHPYHRA